MATDLLRTISSGPLPGPACGCSSCSFSVGNEAVRTGCNTDSSCCGCARSGSGSTGCWSCAMRCGSGVDIAADVNRTVASDDIEVGPDRWQQGLLRLVPMVNAAPAVAEVDPLCQWPAFALGLRRVFSARTGRIRPCRIGRMAAEALGLGEGQLVVRTLYGEDPLVEGFWLRCRIGGLIDQVAAKEWDLVLGLNFSEYDNQPRIEHPLNFQRSLVIAPELAGVGAPAVSNLYWFRLKDLNRYLSRIGDAAPAVEWGARVAGSDPAEAVDASLEDANGITWDLVELDPPGTPDLRDDAVAVPEPVMGRFANRDDLVHVAQRSPTSARHDPALTASPRETRQQRSRCGACTAAPTASSASTATTWTVTTHSVQGSPLPSCLPSPRRPTGVEVLDLLRAAVKRENITPRDAQIIVLTRLSGVRADAAFTTIGIHIATLADPATQPKRSPATPVPSSRRRSHDSRTRFTR